MTPQELQEKVDSFNYWYHRIKLSDEVTTPGWAPIQMEAYRVPLDLTGKRVLDVGAWDGFWTFEALKRGASEVVAIDDFSDDLSSDKSRKATAWEQFDLCRDILGYVDQCRRQECSIYEIMPETFGMFDVVFFFGTLYHCRYPLMAMDRLANVCTDMMLIESAVCDHLSVYQSRKHTDTNGLSDTYAKDHVVMEFYPGAQYAGVGTNWWAPTIQCIVAMMLASGFKAAHGWELTPSPTTIGMCRGFARGLKEIPTDDHDSFS